jgi:TnpA family transposase
MTSPNGEASNTNQYSTYGQYNDTLTPEQLQTFFTLDQYDLELIKRSRSDHTQLGIAIQICTLKFLGTFLPKPTIVPEVVIQKLSEQLGLKNVKLERYANNDDSRLRDRKRISEHFGYCDFEGAPVLRVVRMLLTRLTLANENTNALFDAVTRDLVDHQVVLPGASTISRLINKVRERTNTILYHQLSSRLTVKQEKALKDLLLVPKGFSRTQFERLRAQPTDLTSVSLAAALNRVETLHALGISGINLEDIAQNRIAPIVRHGLNVWASTLEKYSQARCLTTLLVLFQYLERSATDDSLTVFNAVMHELGLRGQRRRQQERLRTLKDLDAAALTLRDTLRDITQVLTDSKIPAKQARASALEQLNASRLLEASLKVGDLASPAEDEEAEIWERAHGSIAKFITPLLNTIKFDGTPTASGLLDAIRFMKRTIGKARSSWGLIPRAFIPKTWVSIIFPDGTDASMNRSRYTVCVMHQLHQALKRGDVFVLCSNQHADPRAQLLSGEAWEHVKHDVHVSLKLPEKPGEMIERLSKVLHSTYKTVAKNLKHNSSVTMKLKDGVLTPVVAPLEALPESPTLDALDANLTSRLPEIDLSEVFLEINARTGFAKEMLLASNTVPHAADLEISLNAVLLAETCNIGLKTVAQENNPALTIARLNWVKQTYLNSDAISRVNAKLVDYHSSLPLSQKWGDGEVASSDGLRFVVPVKSIHSGANPKYYGTKRGITYYTVTSDQFTLLHGQVITGTLRDSMFILAGLLEQQTKLQPVEIMSDTAGYSDVVFGLFYLLGYQFSPRLADVGGSRYWRIDRDAKYGALNDVARNKINTARIVEHWQDVVRLVGSLKLGKVKAPDVMRVLARDGVLNGLGKAVQEVGRVAKTLYLLAYINDESYRRRITTQLNRGESRGGLARGLHHGNKGEIRRRYKSGMELQLGALGLAVNIVIIWNTLYYQAILELINAMGDDVLEEDVARLSPLKWAHINVHGKYEFSMSPDVAGGDLRPLRDPNATRVLELLWEDGEI